MAGALNGIRVIDFGRYISGPYCAMLLADMGAEVIRVERTTGGEDRTLGPVVESGEGGLFLNLNRNKRGITLELTHPQAQRVVSRLVQSSDVVIANMPHDTLKKVGLDFDTLRGIREDVILVMVSAFGAEGPYASRLGFDGVVQAMSGATSLTGFPGAPVRCVVPYIDYGTALHAAFGAMVALYHRQKTGRGQLVDVSLLATGITFMMQLLAEHAVKGIQRTQQGNTHFFSAPNNTYRTRDGWVLVPTIGDEMFRRWARLLDRQELPGDPRCSDDMTRARNSGIIDAAMAEWCACRNRDQAVAELNGARIPGGPVYEPAEVLRDKQVRARGLVCEIEFPRSAARIPIASPAVRMSGTPGGILRRPPTLGEHTDEVLSELGFSPTEITTFREAGVV